MGGGFKVLFSSNGKCALKVDVYACVYIYIYYLFTIQFYTIVNIGNHWA